MTLLGFLAIVAIFVGPAILERVILKRWPRLVRGLGVRVGRVRRLALLPDTAAALRTSVGGDYRTAPARIVDLRALDATAIAQAAAASYQAHARFDADRGLLALVPERTFGKNDSLWVYFLDLRVEGDAVVLVPRFYVGGGVARLASALLFGLLARSVESAAFVAGFALVLTFVQSAFNAFHLRWLPDAAEGLVATALPRAGLGASEPVRLADFTRPLPVRVAEPEHDAERDSCKGLKGPKRPCVNGAAP